MVVNATPRNLISYAESQVAAKPADVASPKKGLMEIMRKDTPTEKFAKSHEALLKDVRSGDWLVSQRKLQNLEVKINNFEREYAGGDVQDDNIRNNAIKDLVFLRQLCVQLKAVKDGPNKLNNDQLTNIKDLEEKTTITSARVFKTSSEFTVSQTAEGIERTKIQRGYKEAKQARLAEIRGEHKLKHVETSTPESRAARKKEEDAKAAKEDYEFGAVGKREVVPVIGKVTREFDDKLSHLKDRKQGGLEERIAARKKEEDAKAAKEDYEFGAVGKDEKRPQGKRTMSEATQGWKSVEDKKKGLPEGYSHAQGREKLAETARQRNLEELRQRQQEKGLKGKAESKEKDYLRDIETQQYTLRKTETVVKQQSPAEAFRDAKAEKDAEKLRAQPKPWLDAAKRGGEALPVAKQQQPTPQVQQVQRPVVPVYKREETKDISSQASTVERKDVGRDEFQTVGKKGKVLRGEELSKVLEQQQIDELKRLAVNGKTALLTLLKEAKAETRAIMQKGKKGEEAQIVSNAVDRKFKTIESKVTSAKFDTMKPEDVEGAIDDLLEGFDDLLIRGGLARREKEGGEIIFLDKNSKAAKAYREASEVGRSIADKVYSEIEDVDFVETKEDEFVDAEGEPLPGQQVTARGGEQIQHKQFNKAGEALIEAFRSEYDLETIEENTAVMNLFVKINTAGTDADMKKLGNEVLGLIDKMTSQVEGPMNPKTLEAYNKLKELLQ